MSGRDGKPGCQPGMHMPAADPQRRFSAVRLLAVQVNRSLLAPGIQAALETFGGDALTGQPKATIAAQAAGQIYPDIRATAINANVVYDLGLGVYRWADVVLGGLDNREARLSINRACYKVNRPWIDGAIEVIQGQARVFVPPGPCYECTMSETDWKLLQMRRSCNLLSKSEMQLGKTPTTPTISSIIAGIQTQEALKLLHGIQAMAGRGR